MSNRRRLTYALLLTLLVGCSQQNVNSPSNLDATTEQVVDERGMGGSGRRDPISAESLQVLNGESGIGGSGRWDPLNPQQNRHQVQALVDERGIGGSGRRQQWLAQLEEGEKIGVLGTISAFGSIWINGLRIHYTENTPVTLDGRAVSVEQLHLGQRAVLTAARINGLLVADSIELINAVVGPVSAVDSAAKQFTILGQQIKLHSATINNLAGATLPNVGDWLQVAGLRDEKQYIYASYISAASNNDKEQATVLLRGQLSRAQAGFSIAGINLTLPDNRFSAKDFVVLRAQLPSANSADSLSVIRASTVMPLMSRPRVELISIERSTDRREDSGPYGPKIQTSPNVNSRFQVLDIQRQGKKNMLESQGVPKAAMEGVYKPVQPDRTGSKKEADQRTIAPTHDSYHKKLDTLRGATYSPDPAADIDSKRDHPGDNYESNTESRMEEGRHRSDRTERRAGLR